MRVSSLLLAGACVAAPSAAAASCPEPDRPDDPACEPRAGMLRPGAAAHLFAPRDRDLGTFVGGGVVLGLLDWSTPRDTAGPGLGRVDLEALVLTQTGPSTAPKTAWVWDLGATLSFEKNPSRRFLVPYYAVHLGGQQVAGLGHRMFVDGRLGLYLVHVGAFSLDASGGYLLPFTDAASRAGVRAALSATIGWW